MRRFLFPSVLLTALLLVAVTQLPSAASQQQAGPESYFPIVRRDPPPTPTPTATPVPVTGTGIYKLIDMYYTDATDGTILYGLMLDWQGNPAPGSLHAEVCFDSGDVAGRCYHAGHNSSNGRYQVVIGGLGQTYEGEGEVAVWTSSNGRDLDDRVSREYEFDTGEGTVWVMSFQECRSDDTDEDCNPAAWALAGPASPENVPVISREEFLKRFPGALPLEK